MPALTEKPPAITRARSHRDAAHEVMLRQEGLATALEAAAFLRVSRATIYRLMVSGELVSKRILGSRRIPWRVLRRFAEQDLVGRGR